MKACIDGAGANGGWLGERLQTLADTLPRGGIDVEGTDCIQKGIWFKLRGNLTITPSAPGRVPPPTASWTTTWCGVLSAP